jgi:effector-binding domain-containing protein
MSGKEENIVKKRVDDMLIASIRFRGKYEEVGEYFDKLYRHCEEHVCGPGFCLYHYETDTEGGVDIEACIPVTQAVEADDIKSRTLEGGQVLSMLHYGPYDKLSETYKKLFDYIKENGIAVSPTEREIYLEWNPDDLEKYVTEIQALLENS